MNNESNLFHELNLIISSINEVIIEDLPQSLKSKPLFVELRKPNPDFEKCFNSNRYKNDSNLITKDLTELKRELIKKVKLNAIPDTILKLKEIILLKELKLNREAINKIDMFLNSLNDPGDYWLSWYLSDLKIKILGNFRIDELQEYMNEPSYKDLRNLAISIYHINDKLNFSKEIENSSAILSFILKVRGESDSLILKFEKLQELKKILLKTPQFNPNTPFAETKILDESIQLINYYYNSFDLLRELITGQFLLGKENSKYQELLSTILNDMQFYSFPADIFLPNLLGLYGVMINTNTDLLNVIFSNYNKEKESRTAIYNGIFWNDGDYATSIFMTMLFQKILIHDYFEKSKFEIHLKSLEESIKIIENLLDEDKKYKIQPEVRVALMTMFILLVEILRKIDISSTGKKSKFLKELNSLDSSIHRWKLKIQQIDFYKKVLKEKNLDYCEANSPLQMVCIKLNKIRG